MTRRCKWALRFKVTSFGVVLVLAARTTIAAPEGPWEWPDQGLGFGGSGTNATVLALLAWNDGSGSALYVGGHFSHAGGKLVQGIARWNGAVWSSLGAGVNGIPSSMLIWNDGNGDALYVAGDYGVAKWNGAIWTPLEGGSPVANIRAIAAFADGSGEALFAGGFGQNLYKWTGKEWKSNTVPGGVLPVSAIFGMAVYKEEKERLFVGGTANAYPVLRAWDGQTWTTRGEFSGYSINTLTTFDDGSGLRLYAAGQFNSIDGSPAKNIAAWNGRSWVKVDNGVPGGFIARDLAVVGDGPAASLYMMGWDVYKLTGNAWEPLEPVDNVAMTGAGFDDGSGPRLHIGGQIWLNNTFKNIARQASSGGGAQCGDLTGDGFVNQQDLGILLGDWGCTKGLGLCPGDCDNDGDTDQADLGILLSNWEKPCP